MKTLSIALVSLASLCAPLHADHTFNVIVDEYQFSTQIHFTFDGLNLQTDPFGEPLLNDTHIFLDGVEAVHQGFGSGRNTTGTFDLTGKEYFSLGSHLASAIFPGGELDAAYSIDHLPEVIDPSAPLAFFGDLLSSVTTPGTAPVPAPDSGSTLLLGSLAAACVLFGRQHLRTHR